MYSLFSTALFVVVVVVVVVVVFVVVVVVSAAAVDDYRKKIETLKVAKLYMYCRIAFPNF